MVRAAWWVPVSSEPSRKGAVRIFSAAPTVFRFSGIRRCYTNKAWSSGIGATLDNAILANGTSPTYAGTNSATIGLRLGKPASVVDPLDPARDGDRQRRFSLLSLA